MTLAHEEPFYIKLLRDIEERRQGADRGPPPSDSSPIKVDSLVSKQSSPDLHGGELAGFAGKPQTLSQEHLDVKGGRAMFASEGGDEHHAASMHLHASAAYLGSSQEATLAGAQSHAIAKDD